MTQFPTNATRRHPAVVASASRMSTGNQGQRRYENDWLQRRVNAAGFLLLHLIHDGFVALAAETLGYQGGLA